MFWSKSYILFFTVSNIKLCVYKYIYLNICVYMCMYIYIYINKYICYCLFKKQKARTEAKQLGHSASLCYGCWAFWSVTLPAVQFIERLRARQRETTWIFRQLLQSPDAHDCWAVGQAGARSMQLSICFLHGWQKSVWTITFCLTWHALAWIWIKSRAWTKV